MMGATSHTGRSSRSTGPEDAARIPPITRAEARVLAEVELERFLVLVETLAPEDWAKPTACTLWNVAHILAHQAGSYAGFARWAEFQRQFSARPARGQLREDVINALQVADRANKTPAELIAELRASGRRAIANRQRIPLALRLLRIPHPVVGFLHLGYLLDIIYSRDTWMHRLDVCRATGRLMTLTASHDGRVVALVMRDVVRTLVPKLGGKAVIFELTGPAGGAWRVGPAAVPAATIRMDALDFNTLASGRCSFDEGHTQAGIEGDQTVAELALREIKVLY